MAFTKKATKAPAVMVETKKISAKDTCACGMTCCGKMKHLLMFILIILNTIMIGVILCNQTKIESEKVGGRANYKMVQQIYKSDAFKMQQAQQIQQVLQMYQGNGQTIQQAVPTTTTPTVDTTTSTVAQ